MNEDRTEFVSDYLSRIKRILDDMKSSGLAEKIDDIVDILLKARAGKKTIFTMGNGGSASTASHFESSNTIYIYC